MSQKLSLFFSSLFLLFIFSTKLSYAIVDPLAVPNNKIGIHVLATSEIYDAVKLINSNGGDWGYITIPIQSDDHDLKKWQTFMYACKKFHIIPIIRLATKVDSNTGNWKKPQLADIINYANFLNQLSWPTQNRYIVIFNEVNRADEWGGAANPSEYANILSFAVTVFKSKSPDFFVISAGLDNAAPNQGTDYINEYDFMNQMNNSVPAIFHQIDGLASHSYPNPGFSQAPDPNNKMGVASFKYERNFALQLTGKSLPVFITETGWAAKTVSDDQKIKYYTDTFNNIWNDSGIVAITPFLFDARTGDFQNFSFRTATGAATAQYQMLISLTKVKGNPVVSSKVLAAEINKNPPAKLAVTKPKNSEFSFSDMLKSVLQLFSANAQKK